MPSVGTGRDVAAKDRIASRMQATYEAAAPDQAGDADLIRDPWQPRWRIDSQWVEFECGCRAERAWPLRAEFLSGDAVIFRGLPEQAVYDWVCPRHHPGMNKIVRFSGYIDFDQWRRVRKHLLMGRTTS